MLCRARTIVHIAILVPTLSIFLGLAAGCFSDGSDSGSDAAAPQVAGNTAPTISGSAPSAARVAEPYTFHPFALDADGDVLHFRGTGLPRWASLDPGNGGLTGTPRPGDEGTYVGITLEVSDGWSSAVLGPFTITVSQTATGTASLSWQAPVANADGSPLTSLAGYRIAYGRDRDDPDQYVTIVNPSTSTYVIERLSPGVWHFAIKAFNRAGIESAPSDLGSKSIT